MARHRYRQSQFAGLTRLQLDEVGRERQVQQQGRQRAEALAERSVEIAQAMVPLAGALARGGGGRAIEARQAAIQAREERRVLFDVLQAGWSDSTFSAKWARLEAEEEACEEDDLTVVGTADRFEDFVGL